MLTKSSPYVWLALALLFVLSASSSYFITLGVLPSTSIAETPGDRATTQVRSTPESSPSEDLLEVSEPTPSPDALGENEQPKTVTSYRAIDALIMITEMGAASGWGFSDPSNKGGFISIPLDSKQNLEAKILMNTCRYTVGDVEKACPWNKPDPVLPAGVWSEPVRLEIDLSKSGNPKPKLIQVRFDTRNSEGTFPVKLQFTFTGWR